MAFGESRAARQERLERQRATFPELATSDPETIFAVDRLRRTEGRAPTSMGIALEQSFTSYEPSSPSPEDDAPNVVPWGSPPPTAPRDPYSDEALNTPAMPPPQGYHRPDVLAGRLSGQEGTLAALMQLADVGAPARSAALNALKGQNPFSVTDPWEARGLDVPFVRDLPDKGLRIGPEDGFNLNLTPKTVAGFALEAALDPTTYIGGYSANSVRTPAVRAVKGLASKADNIPMGALDEPFPVLSPSQEGAIRAQIEQQARQQQYGGQAAGVVRRTGDADPTALRGPDYMQNADEVLAGNKAAAERAAGSTVPVDPTAPYYDPKSVLIQRIADAKPLQTQNEELLSQFRSRQAGAFAGASESGPGGEAGFNRALGAMRGAAERVSFQPLRDSLQPGQSDELFNAVTSSSLRPFEQATAGEALRGILDGHVPTPSAIVQLERVFPGVTDALRKANVLPKESAWEKARRIASDIANAPRALMTSGELSATLRQMAMAAPSHPRAWYRAVSDQWGAYRSLERAQAAMQRIDEHPLRAFLDDMGVDILPIDYDAPFDLREEAFMSRIVGEVPLVERSQRAYTVGMNSMRAGMAYDILSHLSPERLAAMTPQRLEALGDMVNAFNGRGKIPASLEKIQPELNALFFSPKLQFGRVQANLAVFSRDSLVRKEAAKSLVAFYGTGMGILAAANAAGFEVGTTPGTADFGKIVLPGGTRLDIWGGNAQLFRFIANLATGETISSTGVHRDQNQAATVMRFLRTKLAPTPALVGNLMVGKDLIGRETRTPEGLARQAIQMVTPLFIQDIVESVRGAGLAEGAVTGTAAFFGIGTQYQEAPESTDGYPKLTPASKTGYPRLGGGQTSGYPRLGQ